MSDERIKNALLKYSAKQLETRKINKRKNNKPEQETVKDCMKWLKENGFSMSVVESKAVFSVASGGYFKGKAEPGFPDCVGCTPEGIGAFIEFKAKGRMSTLRLAQKVFLKEKILKGAFACVADCPEIIEQNYTKWNNVRKQDLDGSIAYLMSCLPTKKNDNDDDTPLF
jgi:hypothetical protein